MSIKLRLKKFLFENPTILRRVQKTGYDIIWGAHPPRFILKNYGINHIFDVGANKGQFAQQVRASGYNGKIVSFEPIRSVFEILKQNADKDPLWTALNYGCGDYDGEAIINVSEHSVFSSMLEQLPLLKGNYKKPNYVRKEEIKVCKIDSIFNKYYKEDEKVLLKIDTQGFEKKVLEGASASLQKVTAIQLELSFVPHYEGEVLIKEMLDYLFGWGFTLVSLEPLQNNLRKRKFLQADGIFFRLNKV